MKTETSFHATVSCTKAVALRHELRKCWDLTAEEAFCYSGPDWLPLLLANLSKNRRGLVLMMLWRSWHLRNDVIHAKGECKIKDSVSFLNRYLQELGLSNKVTFSEKGKEPMLLLNSASSSSVQAVPKKALSNPRSGWVPPDDGWIKVNVDAPLIQDTHMGFLGCIARNYMGKVLWVCNQAEVQYVDVFSAEAKACLMGLEKATNQGCNSIILESDKLSVVDAIQKRNQSHSTDGKLFENINFLADSCQRFKVAKIDRDGNGAAHLAAALARKSGQSSCWLGSVPDSLVEVVNSESVNTVLLS